MKTEIITLDKHNINMDKIRYAAAVLKQGGLVAFPTETVYGLGANALEEEAVRNIFKAKGRPGDNPLIVHIANRSSLDGVVSEIPPKASCVMNEFWPGPITLVMRKSGAVPPVVTAGLDTVAVRMPSHPVALALISESGIPVAAPSANVSGRPSPTLARHVIEDLSGRVDVIIDAGNCEVGLESTVLDISVEPPMILRPGGITPSQLKAILGDVQVDPALLVEKTGNIVPKSPGMKYRHYSPKADILIIEGELTRVVNKIRELLEKEKKNNKAVGVLATDQTNGFYSGEEVISMGDRDNPETIASALFQALREFDDRGVQLILAEAIDNTGIGLAVMNRLSKAAGGKIIRADS